MKTALPKMVIGQSKKSVKSEIEAHVEKNGWKVLHNGERRLAKVSGLIAVKVVDDEGIEGVVKPETSIGDEEMLHRMIIIGADINLDDTVAILDNSDAIPKEWRDHYFLTGFVCEDGVGRRPVLYFCWDDDRWRWYFYYVENDFNADARFVLPATGCP